MQKIMEQLKEFAMNMFNDEELNELYEIDMCEDSFGLEFKSKKDDGFKSILNLHNVVMRFNDGETIEAITNTMKTALLEQHKISETISDTSFETAKATIFPQIKSTLESPVDLPKRKFDKDGKLSVFYVRDFGNSMVYVTEDNIKDWGISLDELHALAVSNLDKRLVFPVNMQVGSTMANFHVYNSRDGYDATRALVLDIDVLKEKFEGRVCIAMPNRDFLAVVDEKKYNMFALKHQVLEDFRTKPYSVTSDIFVYNDGVWEVLK